MRGNDRVPPFSGFGAGFALGPLLRSGYSSPSVSASVRRAKPAQLFPLLA